MNREILFRGKRADNGEWVEGLLVRNLNDDFCIQDDSRGIKNGFSARTIWPIIPETVGQYTGLKDKNGVKIFEGDIVNVPYNRIGNITVIFEKGKYNITGYNISKLELTGNIHEAPNA